MRIAHLVGFAGALAIATACGGIKGYDTPTGPVTPGTATGGTGTGTATGGTGTGSTTSGTGTGSATGGTGTGTGGAGNGGWFDGPSASGPLTDCSLNSTQLAEIADLLVYQTWQASHGGAFHTDVQTWAAAEIAAAPDQFWGAEIISPALAGGSMAGLGYGFATDGSMALLNPTAPTPLTSSSLFGGLADGYYEIQAPYLLNISDVWSAYYMTWATKLTITIYAGVQFNQTTSYSIDGTPLTSVWVFRYGNNSWQGDPQDAVNQHCAIYLNGNGRTVIPN